MRLTPILVIAVLSLSTTAALADESNQVARGGTLFKEYCSLCHGADGQRGEGFPTPIWGAQSQIRKFEHALGLFEYMLFLMPFDNPNKINEQQKWDIIAYMMANHGAMERTKTIEPSTANSVAIK
ncbi:MAG: c-type cytochrome [Hyphomicrobiaceae bacterium]|jgi:mono/diheme cytochrome c family protein